MTLRREVITARERRCRGLLRRRVGGLLWRGVVATVSMGTIVNAEIPGEEFALHGTFSTIPDVEFDAERVVSHDDEHVMPILWASGPSSNDVTAALADDPTVRDLELLVDLDGEYLYQMTWIEGIKFVIHALVDEGAMIVEARGQGDRWRLRLMFPDRDALSATHGFCEREGLTLDVRSIVEMDDSPSGRHGLTEAQYEALVTAQQRGYFEIPRAVSTGELADDLDISHQALSERLRRGHDVLIEDALAVGADHVAR